MSDDRYKEDIDISGDGSEGTEEFPKEIVQLLMRNHPIKNGESGGEDRDRTHSHIDREEARAARKQRLEEAKQEYGELEEEVRNRYKNNDRYNNDNEYKNNNKFEDDVEYIDNEDVDQEDEFGEIKSIGDEPSFDTRVLFEDNDDDDVIQLVRRTSRSSRKNGYKKGFSPSNVDEIGDIEKVLEEKYERKEKPVMQRSTRRSRKKDHESVEEDFYKIEKPEDTTRVLDIFFDENEDYEDEEKGFNFKYVAGGACIVAMLLLVFLGYKTLSLNGQLKETMQKVEGYEELQVKNEELKLQVLSLQEEANNEAKNTEDGLAVDPVGDGTTQPGQEVETVLEPTENPAEVDPAPETPATNSEYTEYTAVENDSYWLIAEKTIGKGHEYQKILDANGLTEDQPVKAGQVFKIPKQ